jgi:hypothetical protein
VALVLDRDTGLASPQFHVAFDPTFDTVKDMTSTSRCWQVKAGFVVQKELLSKPKPAKNKGASSPTSANSKTSRGRKRKRNETTTEQRQENREPQETEPPPAAANVGDGGQPTPPDWSETHREAEIGRMETTTRSGRKAKAAPRLIEAMTSEIARATASDVEGEIFCYATM